MALDAIAYADKLIPIFEGVRLAPYQDQRGIWTIGVGTRTKPDGTPITKDTTPIDYWTAITWFNCALGKVVAQVDDLVKVKVSDRQLAALYSLAYNIGCTRFGQSTLLRMLNEGKPEQAALRFMDWVFVDGRIDNGLIRRRQAEQSMFKLDLPIEAGGAAPRAPQPAPPPAPNPAPALGPVAETADELNAQELTDLTKLQT